MENYYTEVGTVISYTYASLLAASRLFR